MGKLNAKFEGTSPVMMHNIRLANPIDPFVKAIKEITSKRKKTDADYEALMRLEWEAGLYYDKQMGPGKYAMVDGPIIPDKMIKKTVVEGAKKNKLGKVFTAAVIITEPFVKLEYNGPRDLEKLWSSREFCDYRAVKVQRAVCMRSRPIFEKWSLQFTLLFDDDLLNKRDVLEALNYAGDFVGIGDYRPEFGRFRVEAE
jgi:hypothetical protein